MVACTSQEQAQGLGSMAGRSQGPEKATMLIWPLAFAFLVNLFVYFTVVLAGLLYFGRKLGKESSPVGMMCSELPFGWLST
ncbi:hypothetical protein PAHAL_2G425600 [Panicum hallii]|uniref:Uncharacterized protein n=1 Tax=Panicum hallii TaxID=206008 RepID=A0A2T8KSK0_9POAL|nr:hypothetical protein PAHAL_2G425600 [Panicum hallii]